MTNTEYEKASVNAATGQALLEKCDATIQSLERALVTAQEQRREIVNRYNLNRKTGGEIKQQMYIVGEQGPC